MNTHPKLQFSNLLSSSSVLSRRRSHGWRLPQSSNCSITPLLLSPKHPPKSLKLTWQKSQPSSIYTRIFVDGCQYSISFFLPTGNSSQSDNKRNPQEWYERLEVKMEKLDVWSCMCLYQDKSGLFSDQYNPPSFICLTIMCWKATPLEVSIIHWTNNLW